MATKDCIEAVETAMGRPLADGEMEAIAEAVQARIKTKLDAGLPKGAAVRTATAEISDEASFAAAKAKFRAYDNLVKKANLRARGADTSAEYSTVSPEILSTRANAATTVGTVHDALMRTLVYPMQQAIDRLGLRSISLSRDPAQQLRIVKEMYRYGGDTTVAATGDKNAEALAKIYAGVFEGSRAMQNKEGAFIGKSESPYVGRQLWDMQKTRAVTFDKWREVFGQDRAKDFEGLAPEQITSLLRSQYEALRTGIFDKRGAMTTEGAFNVASKISQERTINFDTPEAFMKARDLYGPGGSIGEGVYAQADTGARNAALMQMFGATPKKTAMEWHQENIRAAAASGDFAAQDKLERNSFPDMFNLVSGLYDQPGNHSLASLASDWRSFMQMSKLGQLFFGGQALVHIPFNAMTVSRADTSIFTSMASQIRALFPAGAEGRQMAMAVQAGHDGMFHGIIRQFHEGDAGHLSAAVNTFYRLNGFGGFMDRQKAAVAIGLTHSMGLNAGKALDQLSPMWQNDLLRYGIGAPEWDAARTAAAKAADGRMHLIPGEIADPKVRAKFQNYISGEVAQGANEPTVWARNAVNAGTQAGTKAGEFMRILTQFKSFPVTMMQRQWGAQFRGGMNVPGVLQLASLTMAAGFIHLQLAGLISNEKQSLPTDAEGWAGLAAKSMVAGGSLGLIADAFLRDGTKTGADVVKNAAGPTFGGPVADLLAAMNVPGMAEAAQSPHTSIGQHMLQAAKNVGADLTPNFWATSAAYNYVVPYMIANWIHPGAIQRHERAMQKNGQSWIVPPH